MKWLSIVDEFTRECLALKVDRGITSEDVIDTLAELFSMRGVPTAIRSDNGPEFVARAIQDWLAKVGVGTLYIEPGSPWQNGYAESFHSRFRDEFLNREEFENVAEARRRTAAWKDDYNHHRPHGSLGYTTPTEFAARRTNAKRRCPLPLQGGLRLRLRPPLRSSGTAVLPNPNSHNPWYNIWGQVRIMRQRSRRDLVVTPPSLRTIAPPVSARSPSPGPVCPAGSRAS